MHGRKQGAACGKRRIRATVFVSENGIARSARTAGRDVRPVCDGARRVLAGAPKQGSAVRAATCAPAGRAARATSRPNGRRYVASFDFDRPRARCCTSPSGHPFEMKCGPRAVRPDNPVGTRPAERRAASSSPQFRDGAASGGRCIASHQSTHLKFSSRGRLEESLLNRHAARATAIPTMPEHYKREPAAPGAVHDTKET